MHRTGNIALSTLIQVLHKHTMFILLFYSIPMSNIISQFKVNTSSFMFVRAIMLFARLQTNSRNIKKIRVCF